MKEKRQPTRLPASTHDFNVVIGIDLLFVTGASPLEEHPTLNVTCVGTLYSTFSLVRANRRSSALVWSTFLQCWLRVFGAPSFMILDQGLEVAGQFINGLEDHGVQPILIDRNAPYQNGVCERRGGLFSKSFTTRPESFINRLIFKKSGILFMNAAGLCRPSPIVRATHLPRGYLVDSQVWLWNCSATAIRLNCPRLEMKLGKDLRPSDLLHDEPWLRLMAATD